MHLMQNFKSHGLILEKYVVNGYFSCLSSLYLVSSINHVFLFRSLCILVSYGVHFSHEFIIIII